MAPKKTWPTAGTLLADLFFLWVIVEYALGYFIPCLSLKPTLP